MVCTFNLLAGVQRQADPRGLLAPVLPEGQAPGSVRDTVSKNVLTKWLRCKYACCPAWWTLSSVWDSYDRQRGPICIHIQTSSVCICPSTNYDSGSTHILYPKWSLDKVVLFILISLEILTWEMWKSLERKNFKSCYLCLISWWVFLLMPCLWLRHDMWLRLEQSAVC